MNRQTELIEEYLSGKLSGKELVEFENQIATDPSLASDLEDHKVVQELIHLRGLIDTKEKLDQIKIRKQAEASKWNKIKWWGGIATVLTIATLSTYTFISSSDSNTSIDRSYTTTSSTSTAVEVDSSHNFHHHLPLVSSKTNGSKDTSKGGIQENQFINVLKDTTFVNVITSEDPLVGSENPLPTEIKKDSVKKNTAGTPNDPCLNVVINGDIKTENTCTGVSNGKLFISNVRGGTGPYLYSLQCLTSNSVYASGTTINYWDNMEAGSYRVVISDANKCSTEVLTDIKSKYCETGKKSIFNPDLGEVWTYPLKPNANGTVRIYDSGGVLVFETTIKNNYPSNWEGRGKDGALLNAGGYVYQILYEDGSYDQGSVTIAR
jgi:hypothetical protein